MSPPLPDASKKSPRVYRNLQTKDLENVTFSDMEATGDPLSIELHNEDELRRLVLVQLARLTTKSEWTGLLTAGGGGMTSFDLDADTGTAETVTNGNTVKIAGGTAIGTAVTSPDTVTITNTGVTSLTAGSNITLSGSTGAVTVSASSSTPTQNFQLAGDSGSAETVPTDGTGTLSIDGGTGISTTVSSPDTLTIANDGVTSLTAGTNITLSGSTGAVTISASSSGGSATWNPKIGVGPINSGFQDAVIISRIPPWGQMVTTSNSTGNLGEGIPRFWPFIMPKSATIDKITIAITGSADGQYDIGIYEDSDGLPSVKIETYSLSDSSYITGNFSISSSSTNTYTEGRQYWLAVVQTGGTGNVQAQFEAPTGFQVAPYYLSGSNLAGNLNARCCIKLNNSTNTLPSSVTTSDLFGSSDGMLRTAIQF